MDFKESIPAPIFSRQRQATLGKVAKKKFFEKATVYPSLQMTLLAPFSQMSTFVPNSIRLNSSFDKDRGE